MDTVDEMYDGDLPASIHAERTILGSILIDSAYYYKKVVGRLSADDFSLDSHRTIFLRMAELIERDSAADIITLCDCLERHKEREEVGGAAYICSLTEGLPHRISLKDYLRIVREKSQLRRIISACQRAMNAAYEQSPSSEIIGELVKDLALHPVAEEKTA